MKTNILIHENEQWVYYPDDYGKIDHRSGAVAGESFFFDPINGSATSVIPQPATVEDPRAGHLYISLKFDEDELNWFLENPYRIKGLKEWLKNISKADAKKYAMESSSKLPRAEIEEKAKESPLDDAEKKIALQMMSAIIQRENTDIFVIARNQRDDLIINILKSLPEVLKKVEFAMPWSSGMDLGRMNLIGEDELPNISSPMYVVRESSTMLINKYPNQFTVATIFFKDKRWSEDKNFKLEDIQYVYDLFEKYKNKVPADENPEKIVYDLYELFKKNKDKKPKISDIVDFYVSCKNIAKEKNVDLSKILDSKFCNFCLEIPANKLTDSDNYDFYVSNQEEIDKAENLQQSFVAQFYAFCAEAVNKGKTLSDILKSKFYGFYKQVVEEYKDVKSSWIFNIDFYDYYVKNNIKADDPHCKLYIDVVKAGKEATDILNSEFDKLCKKIAGVANKNVSDFFTLKFYGFYADVYVPAKKNPPLLSVFNFYEFYTTVEDHSAILDFYIFFVDAAIDESFLNQKFYDLFKATVVSAKKQMDCKYVLKLYQPIQSEKIEISSNIDIDFLELCKNIADVVHKNVSDFFHDKVFLNFYGNVYVPASKHPEPLNVFNFYEFYKTVAVNDRNYISSFYKEFYLKAVEKYKKQDLSYILTQDYYRLYKEYNNDNTVIESIVDVAAPEFHQFYEEVKVAFKHLHLDLAFYNFYKYVHTPLGKKLTPLVAAEFYKNNHAAIQTAIQNTKTLQDLQDSDISKFYEFCAEAVKNGRKLTEIFNNENKFYKLCKGFVAPNENTKSDEKLQLSDVLNLDFYRFYTDVTGNNGQIAISDFEFYKTYKSEILSATDLTKSNIPKLYQFYVEVVNNENAKNGIFQNILKKIFKNKNSGRDIVLTQKFYEFYTEKVVIPATNANQQVLPSDIFNFYKFYNSAKDKKLKLDNIVEFYEFYTHVVELEDYKNMKSGEISKCYHDYKKGNLNKDLQSIYNKLNTSERTYSSSKVTKENDTTTQQSNKFKEFLPKCVTSITSNNLVFCLLIIIVAVVVVEYFLFIQKSHESGGVFSTNSDADQDTDEGLKSPAETSKVESLVPFTEHYSQIQKGMLDFMKAHNMTGSVFAYRPSNGDVYCMTSTSESQEEGTDIFTDNDNKNLKSFTPGATIRPLTLLILQTQDIDFNGQKIKVENQRDRYHLSSDDKKIIACWGSHATREQSVVDGLGNSCDSFFAELVDKELDLGKAKETLEAMDFFAGEYEKEPDETILNSIAYKGEIDKIPYSKSVFPFEKTMLKNFSNVQNFIGEGSLVVKDKPETIKMGNLLVSPIDMAVWTALFGKLSENEDSDVCFPRIYLPADENKQKEVLPELLLTEKKSTNPHISKLSNFVSEHKSEINNVGTIWKEAFDKYYRHPGDENKPCAVKQCHLDGGKLTNWSQWIDLALVGNVNKLPDETHPDYQKCQTETDSQKRENCLKTQESSYRTRAQGVLSFYSEKLDLAAYIVIENYSGMYSDNPKDSTKNNSKIKLASTSMMLTKLVAEAIGEKLDPEKQKIEGAQWDKFNVAPKKTPQKNKNPSNGKAKTKPPKAPATQQESTLQQQ